MHLILALTGATGAWAARRLLETAPWPVTLVASTWGRAVYERECEPFEALARRAARVYANDDLAAPIASGAEPTAGMVILPCSTNTLAKVAGGLADTLIARAAHCHLKERRPLVLCVREAPWSLIDLHKAAAVSAAGGIVMPLAPPFFVFAGRAPETVTLAEVFGAYVERVLAVCRAPAAEPAAGHPGLD